MDHVNKWKMNVVIDGDESRPVSVESVVPRIGGKFLVYGQELTVEKIHHSAAVVYAVSDRVPQLCG